MESSELLLASSGARVLLVGSGTYVAGSRLPEVPAVASTVNDLGRCLVERAGLDPSHLTTLIDPPHPGEFGAALVAAAEQASDVLFVYYVGHGLVSARNELHLATRATQDLTRGIAAHQALPYEQIRQVLADSSAALTVIGLDCCFSGRAQGFAQADLREVFTSVRHGMYLLTSTNRDESAWAPPGQSHTAFSGALIELLSQGDPTAPRLLTLDNVHQCLSRTLLQQGFPEPRRQATGHGDRLPFAPNPAHSSSRQTGQEDQRGQFSPYRGLAAFGPQDARFFFGRAELTHRLVDRVAEQLDRDGPLLVTGPSGSGKSSLLGAGLIAHLDRSSPGSWVSFTPGEDPLRVLAERFAPLSDLHPADVRQSLEAHPGYLRELLSSTAAERGGRPVIVVDQFEELFTACLDERQRRLFIQALHAACAAPTASAPAMVVVGMRADFLGHCATYPELLAALERPVFVSPMTSGQLRRVIEEPAIQAGLVLQDGLVELLLEDLGADMTRMEAGGVLPLLSHALLATWQHRQGQTLTLTGYRATGGLSQALARTADATLAPLDLEGRQNARQLLPRLVRLGEGTEDTRRRLRLEDLLPPSAEPQRVVAQRVLDRFVHARLVTVDDDTVEITHEALIRAWPQLRAWIETDRAGLLIEQHLADAARTWDHDGRDPAGLYRGSRLTLSADWAGDPRHRDRLGPLSQSFLTASLEGDLAEQRATRRRSRLLAGVTAVLAVLVVALATVGIALQQQSVDLGREQRATAAQRLAFLAATLRDDDPGNALRLGAAAMRIDPNTETRSALVATLIGNHYRATLKGRFGVVSSVAMTPDGRTVITGGYDSGEGIATVWDMTDHARPVQLATLPSQVTGISQVAVTPDGRIVITGGDGGIAMVWDVSDRAHPVRLATLENTTAIAYSLTAVAVTSDGRTVITGFDGPKGIAMVWDVSNRARPVRLATLAGHNGSVSSVAVTPNGRTVITGGHDGTAIVWDLADRAHPARRATLAGHTDNVAVAVTPDGRTLITGGGEGIAMVWDMADRARPVRLATLAGHNGSVSSVAVTPDGGTVITGGNDGTAIVWNVADRARPVRSATLAGHTDNVAVAVTPDGRTVITGSRDGTAMVWEPRPARLAILKGRANQIDAVAVTPDVRTVITSGYDHDGDGIAMVWDMSDRTRPARLAILPGLNYFENRSAVAVTSDGRTAITGGNNSTAIVWDLADRTRPPTMLATLPGHTDTSGVPPEEIPRVSPVAVTRDGGTVITGGGDGTATVWDLADRTRPARLATLTGHTGRVDAVAVTSDGRTVITGSRDGTALVWDVADRAHPVRSATLKGHTDGVSAMAVTPDGRTVITVGGDGTAMVWDVADRTRPARLATLTGQEGLATTVAVTPDGRTVITVGGDGTALVWDVADRAHPARLATLTGLAGSVSAVAITSDGRTVITVGDEGTAMVWDVAEIAEKAAHPLKAACAILDRELSSQEWSQYAPGVDRLKICGA